MLIVFKRRVFIHQFLITSSAISYFDASIAFTTSSTSMPTNTTPTTSTIVPSTTETIATSISPTTGTTVISTTTQPKCDIESALVDDRFLSKPKFSTPIIGAISDLNPDGKGIDFMVITPSTSISIVLPLKQNTVITNLNKLQILRPSNVNRFQLTFLNKQNKLMGQYRILSTDSTQLSTSPTIDVFPIEKNLLRKIRSLKIEILDTNNNHPPKHVTILFQACFKQREIPIKSKNKLQNLSNHLIYFFFFCRKLYTNRCYDFTLCNTNHC